MEGAPRVKPVPTVLVDYGVGNIHSLAKALERAGAAVTVAADEGAIASARVLVLPGVGAFGRVMESLRSLASRVIERVRAGVPTLGVCAGMQVLYESGEEGPAEGLGLLRGRVARLAHPKLPHIGWNRIGDLRGPLFEGLPKDPYVYFVHSFAAPANGDAVAARTEYGTPFAAAAGKDNLWGVQFHPEKSSAVGLKILENFVRFAANRIQATGSSA